MPESTTLSESFKPVVFTEDDIGVLLLESITKGLYTDARNSVREYVQNEFDADAQRVAIEISGRRVSITGDGEGMTGDGLLKAQRLGFSEKNPARQAGFRGIGIWSGVAVCRQLNVITKRADEHEGHYLRVDADGLRRDIAERANKSLTKALSDHVVMKSVRHVDLLSKHGTRVELVDVLPEHQRILSQPELFQYLQQIAPVPIDPRHALSGGVEKKLQAGVPGYHTLNLTMGGRKVYRPPQKEAEVQAPRYEFIERPNGEKLALLWYAMHAIPGLLPDPSDRGLVYKSKGFTVGDLERSVVKKLAPDSSFIGWVTGEIHLIHPDLLPNSERVDLEAGQATEDLRSWLKNRLRMLTDEIREFSHERAAETHIADARQIVKETLEEKDPKKRIPKLTAIDETVRVVKGALQSSRTPQEQKPALENSLKELNKVKKLVLGGLESPKLHEKTGPSAAMREQSERQLAKDVSRMTSELISQRHLSPDAEKLLRYAVDELHVVGVADARIVKFLEALNARLAMAKGERR